MSDERQLALAETLDDCRDAAICPPWAKGPMPDPYKYVESELFVAGALSTMPPFAQFHPAWCLPFARQAIEALSEWVPTDS